MDKQTRRDFFKEAGTLAAAAMLAANDRVYAANDKLNVAIIGAGQQGQRDLKYCLENAGTKCVAICEIHPANYEAANKIAGGQAKHYTDWNEMLAKEDLDAILIGLPEDTHHPAAIAAMKKGCHVFCEKPMAYSIEQGHEMVKVSRETGKVLQIGQQRRCHPLYYLAEELLQRDKVCGDIIRVDAFWDRWSDWVRPMPDYNLDVAKWGYPTFHHLINWRLYRKYGHGLMTENGTHQLDVASWLLGNRRPKSVTGIGVTYAKDGRETHDVVSANYLFDGDVIVRFSQDFRQGYNFGWNYGELFLGDKGSLRIIECNRLTLVPKGKKEKEYSMGEVNKGNGFELAGIKYTAKELTDIKIDNWLGWMLEQRNFVHCCRTGEKPACTAEIGHNSIVPTIVGTEAQYAKDVIDFKPEWWAQESA